MNIVRITDFLFFLDYNKILVRSLLSSVARDLLSVIFFYQAVSRPVELVGLLRSLVVVRGVADGRPAASKQVRSD